MNITLKKITVRELTAGYIDHEEGGVKGYSGKLDIRPPYQNSFMMTNREQQSLTPS